MNDLGISHLNRCGVFRMITAIDPIDKRGIIFLCNLHNRKVSTFVQNYQRLTLFFYDFNSAGAIGPRKPRVTRASYAYYALNPRFASGFAIASFRPFCP